jgi:DNA-binding PadR family transcriptional regulator
MPNSQIPSIPTKELRVLDLLAAKSSPAYGLELVRRSKGDLPRGSVYVLLDRLEEKGLVESWQEDQPDEHAGLPRRLYKITASGQRARRMIAVAAAVWHGRPLPGV